MEEEQKEEKNADEKLLSQYYCTASKFTQFQIFYVQNVVLELQ